MRVFDVRGKGSKSGLVSLYLQRDEVGAVHSKYKRGLHLQFQDKLIYIGGGNASLCCFGISVEGANLPALLAHCAPGDLAAYTNGVITVYCAQSVFRIHLDCLREVNLRIPRISASMPLAASELYRQLKRTNDLGKIGLEADGAFREGCRILLMKDEMGRNYVNALQYFIGRGRGLTPAGDDILLGYGAALTAFGRETAFVEALKSALKRRTTTEVSIACYQALLRGYANAAFIQLIHQLEESDRETSADCVARVRRIGHTSGSDTLFGFYLGLKKLAGEAGNNG